MLSQRCRGSRMQQLRANFIIFIVKAERIHTTAVAP